MNLVHRWLCSSSRWQRTVEQHVLPWAPKGVNLGSQVLEVGPGYGATTTLLQRRAAQLTCVELDPKLAAHLRRRNPGMNVSIVCEDATKMSFPNASFDGAACFTMLHHVASAKLQDQLLGEVARTLRPGGVFAGTDSLDSRFFRLLHFHNTLVPIDPATFSARLEAAGFEKVYVEVNPYAFRFRAYKPLEN